MGETQPTPPSGIVTPLWLRALEQRELERIRSTQPAPNARIGRPRPKEGFCPTVSVGHRFGRWTVVGVEGDVGHVRCLCGIEDKLSVNQLRKRRRGFKCTHSSTRIRAWHAKAVA
jgi:hypothetical protein